MRGLTIRNLEDDTLDWLRERAEAHGRSLNAELLDMLAVMRADELAASRRDAIGATLRRARAMGVRTRSTGAAIVREARDRRAR